MTRRILFQLLLVVIYLALEGGLYVALVQLRGSVQESFTTENAQDDWNRWIDEAQRQSDGNGPVRRRVPNSAEPPTLVLLRDYFPTCVFGTWLFSTLLFVSSSYFGWALIGQRSGRTAL
jgi:hypothetical protein